MSKVLYTAKARVTGGRDAGHGETTDGSLAVDLRLPAELGGPGQGTNPEQLFAIGFASCFESAMGTVARRLKVEPGDVAIDSKVMLIATERRTFELGVELDVTVEGLEPEQAVELVRTAHGVCPYSLATRGNVDVTLSVNGATLDG